MNKSIKTLLWGIISISVSILLVPTIISIFGIDLRQHDILHSLTANSGEIFVLIATLSSVISGMSLLLISSKERNAKMILTEAVDKDAIWDVDTLTYNTRMVFYKVQNAWNNNDTTLLQDYCTPGFKEHLKNKIADARHYTNINFDITDTNIICCQDFVDNNKDRYEGYIQGNIIDTANTNGSSGDDYTNDQTQISANNQSNDSRQFSEIYHFVRSQNDWLLNKIDFKISIWDLLTERNEFEQGK